MKSADFSLIGRLAQIVKVFCRIGMYAVGNPTFYSAGIWGLTCHTFIKSSRSQMFFKVSVLKNFAILT